MGFGLEEGLTTAVALAELLIDESVLCHHIPRSFGLRQL